MNIHAVNINPLTKPGRTFKSTAGASGTSVKERHSKAKNNSADKNNQINTSITSNSDARVSFKGGAPFLHKAANFASDNPLVAEALFALAITCGLRPLTIMATAKTEEDKEKCAYQAAKSVSSGLVGLGMTAAVGMPIAAATKAANKRGAFAIPENIKQETLEKVKPGIDALKKVAGEVKEIAGVKISELTEGGKINSGVFKKAGKTAEHDFIAGIKDKLPEEADKIVTAIHEQKVLDNYARAGKNVADKFFQPIFMPLRATVTIALVPVILGILGLKKSSGKSQNATQDENPYKNMDLNFCKRPSKVFDEFSKAVK